MKSIPVPDAPLSEQRHGIVCPYCHQPMGVARSWPAGRGLVKRRRSCDNARCPYRKRTRKSYRQTSEERVSKAYRPANTSDG